MSRYLRNLPARAKSAHVAQRLESHRTNRSPLVTRLSTALDEMEQKSRMAQWDEALDSPLSPAEQDFAQRRMPVEVGK